MTNQAIDAAKRIVEAGERDGHGVFVLHSTDCVPAARALLEAAVAIDQQKALIRLLQEGQKAWADRAKKAEAQAVSLAKVLYEIREWHDTHPKSDCPWYPGLCAALAGLEAPTAECKACADEARMGEVRYIHTCKAEPQGGSA